VPLHVVAVVLMYAAEAAMSADVDVGAAGMGRQGCGKRGARRAGSRAG